MLEDTDSLLSYAVSDSLAETYLVIIFKAQQNKILPLNCPLKLSSLYHIRLI